MACKNSIPIKRCGDCLHFNCEAYRGVGIKVCYELGNNELQKTATTVSEGRKACDQFIRADRFKVAN
ncbi:hypothetical protein [Pelosinus sp. sgz500959]|uniref:hypothetical protein n=1 Tax=Pelosinus sp. sgz500959 TaxID=3242472 RepID=UPI00366E5481